MESKLKGVQLIFWTEGELGNKRHDVCVRFNRKRTELKEFRNAQFHFKSDPDAHVRFFEDPQALAWAETLHAKMAGFFSDYRVEAAVGYAIAGRDMRTGL